MESKVEIDAATSQLGMGSSLQRPDVFGGLTVEQVIGPGLGAKLPLANSLRDAAAALAASDRTAAAVADEDGNLVGLFTESDVMRAYFEEAEPSAPIALWLSGGLARAAGNVMRRLCVLPTDSLASVAERMTRNAVAGDCACHHVLVQEECESDEGRCAVLSALDMVQALCRPDMLSNPLHHPFQELGGGGHLKQAPAAKTAVKEVMKPKDHVFTCKPNHTMREALKILLMTQQNSVLVVDDEGIYGLMTPRDAVRAFSEGVALNVRISDWLRGLSSGVSSRLIACDSTVGEAAAAMTARHLNHLIVVRPGSNQAIGVLSSLDLAVWSAGSRAPAGVGLAPLRQAGPTVGEVVAQNWHLAAICNRGATLAEASMFLATSGRTSAAVALGGDSPPLGLLTENDVMRAYVDGWPRDFTVERWLLVQESSRPAILPPLLVPPATRLTDAAALMLGASRPGLEPCRHLVVKGTGLGWEGIFSALDVARALCGLGSELEVARTGVDALRVSMVMKPADAVPVCKPGDSLKDALSLLLCRHQHGLLVVDDERAFHGILTPRCALQALAEDVPPDASVGAWLRQRAANEAPREVAPGAALMDAAAAMVERCLHHLVVREPSPGSFPVGVVSSLDVVRGVASMRSQLPFSSLGWLWSVKGPSSCALWQV